MIYTSSFGFYVVVIFQYCFVIASVSNLVLTRGRVEDTRFEAKAKDTKKSEAKAKDSSSEDKPSRCQGQECSRPRPRTQAQVFSKKKVFKNFFHAFSGKKRLLKFFSGDLQNFNNSKNSAVLEPRTGQFSRT